MKGGGGSNKSGSTDLCSCELCDVHHVDADNYIERANFQRTSSPFLARLRRVDNNWIENVLQGTLLYVRPDAATNTADVTSCHS